MYIPLPDLETRVELLKLNLRTVKLAEDVNVDALAAKINGYSGADITNVSVIEWVIRFVEMQVWWVWENVFEGWHLIKSKTSRLVNSINLILLDELESPTTQSVIILE